MIKLKQKCNENQYHVIGIINKQLSIILIDTGACMSYISSDLVKEIYEAEREFRYLDFSGIEHIHDKISEIEIIFNSELSINFEILVDFQDKTKEVLLGIDFLENFSYTIKNEEVILEKEYKRFRLPRIRLNSHSIRERLN